MGPEARARMYRGRVTPPVALPVTSIPRTLVDLALTAVATAEWAIQQGVDLSGLAELADGRRGGRRVQPWWSLVEPQAANRLETCARLHLIDAGLQPDAVQYPIYQEGTLVAVADMAFIAQRVLVETDGFVPHSQPDQFNWDRRRLTVLRELGWTVIIFTWADMRSPAYMEQTVRRALAQAA